MRWLWGNGDHHTWWQCKVNTIKPRDLILGSLKESSGGSKTLLHSRPSLISLHSFAVTKDWEIIQTPHLKSGRKSPVKHSPGVKSNSVFSLPNACPEIWGLFQGIHHPVQQQRLYLLNYFQCALLKMILPSFAFLLGQKYTFANCSCALAFWKGSLE